jgi:hypothetical protein
MANMNQTSVDCTPERMDQALNDLKGYVAMAAAQGCAAHEVEADIWRRVLRLGHQAMGLLFQLVGTGEVGESTVLPDGREVRCLEGLHARAYQSVFGYFEVERTVYGSREGQKIEYVPVDTQLQLPESEFSYLRQDWTQGLAVEHAYRHVPETLGRILDVKPTVDSGERMNQKMAQSVRGFRQSRPAPEPESEGALCGVSADGKGVPIRRHAPEVPIAAHDRDPKPQTNRKQMAVVGAVYTIDPFVRTPEESVDSLFRGPGDEPLSIKRPEPQHQRLGASLPQDQDGELISATDETFGWLAEEVARRNPESQKPTVLLRDGQKSLWEAGQRDLPPDDMIEILDLLHATPRIWEAAALFYDRDSEQAWALVYDRVLRILRGEGGSVVSGLRQMGTKRKLRGKKREQLAKICGYLQNNAPRMRYDASLAAGYPIASGVIEGACRHLVKDPMERSGMRWTLESAQAMLDVRSTYINGDGDAFMAYRIAKETQRLYPHRALVEPIDMPEKSEMLIAA